MEAIDAKKIEDVLKASSAESDEALDALLSKAEAATATASGNQAAVEAATTQTPAAQTEDLENFTSEYVQEKGIDVDKKDSISSADTSDATNVKSEVAPDGLKNGDGEQITKDIIIEKYLSYQDATKEEHIREARIRSVKEGESSESAAKYAEAIMEMSKKVGFQELMRLVNGSKEECADVFEKLGLELSPYNVAQSNSWAMWDLGKQYYFFTHPDKNDPRYKLSNPLESEEKIEEIIDRHIGHEFMSSYWHNSNKVNILERMPGVDAQKIAELRSFIEEQTDENGGPKRVSSDKLAELGALIKTAIPNFKHKNLLNTDGENVKVGNTAAAAAPQVETAPDSAVLLQESGNKLGVELTALWSKMSEEQRAEAVFAGLAQAGGDGKALFDSFIEKLDDEVKQGAKAEDVLQESVNVMTTLRDKARNYTVEQDMEDFGGDGENISSLLNGRQAPAEGKKEAQMEPKEELKESFGSEGENIENLMGGRSENYRNQKIEELREEVNAARKEFVEMEHKKKSMWKSVRNFLPGRAATDKKVTREIEGKPGETADVLADDDVLYMRALYDNKMFDYKEAVFEEMKNKGLEGPALEKAIRDTTLEVTKLEKLAVYDAKTDLKEASMKDTNLGIVKKYWQASVDWYRKLPKKEQRLITVGLWAGAGAATFGGATGVAAGFAALGMAKRFLVGSSTGMASYAGADKIAEKVRNWRDNKNADEMATLYQRMSPEERINMVKKTLNKEVLAVNDKVNRQEYWDTFRMTGAAVFGATLGSGVLGHWLSDQFGLGEKMHGALSSMAKSEIGQRLMSALGIDGIHDGFTPSTNAYENGMSQGAHSAFTPSSNAFEHAPGNPLEHVSLPTETLTVVEGSSFEGTMIKYLGEHRDELIRLQPQLAKLDNGQIAHRLALDYGSKALNGELPDYVKAGAKMTFDPKTLEIHFLDRNDVGHFPDAIPDSSDQVEGFAGSELGEEELNKEFGVEDESVASQEEMEEVAKAAVEEHKQEELLKKKADLKTVQGSFTESSGDYGAAAREASGPGVDDQTMQKLQGKMGVADKLAQQSAEYIKNNTDFFPETAKQADLIARAITGSDGKVWSEFQNLEYDRAVADDRIGPRLKEIKAQFEKEIGKPHAFTPKDGETVREWAKRIAYRTMEKRYGIAN